MEYTLVKNQIKRKKVAGKHLHSSREEADCGEEQAG